MAALPVNLVIEQGTDFEVSLTIKTAGGSAVNLTGYSGVARMKKSYYSQSYTPFSITWVDRPNGVIKLTLANTVTAALEGGRYVYDLTIESAGAKKTRVIEGLVTVTPGATT